MLIGGVVGFKFFKLVSTTLVLKLHFSEKPANVQIHFQNNNFIKFHQTSTSTGSIEYRGGTPYVGYVKGVVYREVGDSVPVV
jgi:hypothetical protein